MQNSANMSFSLCPLLTTGAIEALVLRELLLQEAHREAVAQVDNDEAELIDLLALCGALTVNALPAAGAEGSANAIATALDAATHGFRTRVLLGLCAGVAPATTASANWKRASSVPRSSAPLLLPETMAKGAVVKVGRARAPPV
mgnify:CR=1 FL=1